MPKINDVTVVDWLVEEKGYTQDSAWKVATDMLAKDNAEKEPKAPRQRTEWLVVVADPAGNLKNNMIGFVVQKKKIKKNLNMEDTGIEREWGDEEADAILQSAFNRCRGDVRGIGSFVNLLRASKKLLKEEYGFDIKTKEGCYIAPIHNAAIVEEFDEDAEDGDEDADLVL